MRLIGLRCHLLAAVLMLIVSLGSAHADEAAGSITDIAGTAEIVFAGGKTSAAAKGAPVYFNDELRTGADGYLQITFRDDTVLTLAEDAHVVIDRYVFNPDESSGELLLSTTKGAFRFATGRLKEMTEKDIQVATPVANVGVRGTEFWGGPVEGEYSVVLLDGDIDVRNKAGTVRLNQPGLATVIRSRSVAPLRPSLWSADQIQRAVARTFTREGMKQFERQLRKLKLPSRGKDMQDLLKQKGKVPDALKKNNLPDALKRKDTVPDAFKRRNTVPDAFKRKNTAPDTLKRRGRKYRIDPGGAGQQLQRAPKIPKFW